MTPDELERLRQQFYDELVELTSRYRNAGLPRYDVDRIMAYVAGITETMFPW